MNKRTDKLSLEGRSVVPVLTGYLMAKNFDGESGQRIDQPKEGQPYFQEVYNQFGGPLLRMDFDQDHNVTKVITHSPSMNESKFYEVSKTLERTVDSAKKTVDTTPNGEKYHPQ